MPRAESVNAIEKSRFLTTVRNDSNQRICHAGAATNLLKPLKNQDSSPWFGMTATGNS